ncbi:hypothetical protein OAA45_00170 [bacterium]|nr:hypothetical protein [bacterium]
MKRIPRTVLYLAILATLQTSVLQAAKYYVVPLSDIGFTQPEVHELNVSVGRFARTPDQAIRYPNISLNDGSAEAYIASPEPDDDDQRWWGNDSQSTLRVALKLNEAKTVSGKVSLVSFNGPTKATFKFEFDPSELEKATEADFDAVRKSYYARLSGSRLPGGDWFRYQAGDAYKADDRARRWRNLGQFDSSFNMFTGQRAVSENLALDRELILATSKTGKPIDIDTIKGVTVEAIDWSDRIVDEPTPIDALAMVIPHDQHAAFFGSIKELNQVIRMVEKEGISYFQTLSNRKTYEGLARKYQKQMGIFLPSILAEKLPVKSVAVSGGDPFFPSGTDVSVIFETDTPDTLSAALKAVIKTQAEVSGASAGENSSFSNVDRSFSAFFASGDNYVVVSNTAQQVERIKDTASGGTPSLGSLEEFKFFRQRYALDNESTAFIFLSDATIRRWAGPRFRIGASRRVRAAAAIGHATAQFIDGTEIDQASADLVGEITVEKQTVRSERFNTIDFLTPISELDIKTVSPAEKAGYERWRRGYENSWVRFDPIAVSIELNEHSLDLDMSVIPMRLNSDYDEWTTTAGDATLDKEALTAHSESVFVVSHAIDTSSETFKMADMQSSSMLPGIGANPLAWVGGSLTIFVDQDPYWEEMHEAKDPEDFIEDHLNRLPVGLRVSSKSPMKLAMFLTTLRSFSEQAAPGLLKWETRKYGDTAYVVVRTTDQTGLNMDINIHYAALTDAFLLSLNEDVLKRAISRSLDREDTEKEEPSNRQVFAQAKISALKTYLDIIESDHLLKQQFASWAALPILNEWKKAFPDKDPIQVHADYFKEAIYCPGGQGFQWNEALGSMESVAFGLPAAPRGKLIKFPILQGWDEAKATIGLKNNELRLEASLTK